MYFEGTRLTVKPEVGVKFWWIVLVELVTLNGKKTL
jgi:hypothetical protein